MNSIYFALFLVGFSSLTAQTLLIRELINVFSGNELVYGLTLSIWLILVSAGSFIGSRLADKIENRIKFFISTQMLLVVAVPASVFLSRMIKTILKIPVGIMIGIDMTFLITVLIFMLPCVVLGLQFSFGVKMLREKAKDDPGQIGRMYFLESIGSLCGGAVFSFFLIYFFNAFQIAGILCLLLSFSGLSLYKNHVRKYAAKPLKLGPLLFFSLILAIAAILIYPSGSAMDLESSRIFWQDYQLVETRDSLYGRIAVIRSNDEFSFYRNANLLFSTADPASAEELIHLSFLEHPSPKRALLIGGGLGGELHEAAKYGIVIDYIEIDPKVLSMARKLLNSILLPEDGKISMINVDGRHFVNTTREKYDLIIINVGDPEDALVNRYYTLDFFLRCKRILGQGGVLSINLSNAEGFLGNEMRSLNSSIYKTLKVAYPFVTMIPSNRNYYFASEEDVPTDKANRMIKRWFGYKIRTSYFNAYAIPYIVYPFKISFMKDSIRFDERTKLNKDTAPISYYYSMMLWFSRFPSPVKGLLLRLSGISTVQLVLLMLTAIAAVKLSSLRVKRTRKIMIPASIGLMGFIGMAGQMLMLYSFQSFYGYIYSLIGFLMALFMSGLAFGSYLVNRDINKVKSPLLCKIAALLTALLIIIYLYLSTVPAMQNAAASNISKYVLPVFIFLLAAHVGAYFPAAAKLFYTENRNIARTAGVLYGFDLFGGALASLTASVLLIPLVGLTGLSFVLITAAVGCFVLMLKI